MYHKTRTEYPDLLCLPGWKCYRKIFLVDHECLFDQKFIDADSRIHLWDSTIVDHPRIHTYAFWFDWTREVDENVNHRSRIQNPKHKSCDKFFDVLLGTMSPMRWHKEFVLERVENHGRDVFLLGSRLDSSHLVGQPKDWISGGDYDQTSSQTRYNTTQSANVACFLPYEIYNRTWYTICCETRPGLPIFFTEKVARPLLSRRLFVFFGAKNFLRDLRSLGFQTFGSVIDERYDEIDNDHERWTQAWKQVQYLLDQNPLEIYDQLTGVLEHNHDLFMRQNWKEKMCQEMRDLLTQT